MDSFRTGRPILKRISRLPLCDVVSKVYTTLQIPLWGKGDRPASAVGESENPSNGTICKNLEDGRSVLPSSSPAQHTLPHLKESPLQREMTKVGL